MRRTEVRLRKARQARRYHRFLRRARTAPTLLFTVRAAVREPVAVERGPGGSGAAALAGFWRGEEFYPVRRVLETRREYDAVYVRVLTDRGCFDLRRYRAIDPWTLRSAVGWEMVAELDAIEVRRPF